MNLLSPVRCAGICFVVLFGIAAPLGAQKGASNTGPSTGAAMGNTGTSGAMGNKAPFGTSTTTNSNGTFDQSRPFFLSGDVLFDDGIQPNNNIRIERVCGGRQYVETHTDSRGHFSFQVGGQVNNNIAEADASDSSFGSERNTTGSGLLNNGAVNGPSSLMGCELRAAYPGYVSEVVELSIHRSMDDSRVGTIVLHRLVGVKGTTISVTTAEAPKAAQKSYEKGFQLAQKGKLEEAEQKLSAATGQYPKYAIAWFALGQVQQKLHRTDDARRSYLAATQSDNRYVNPYDQLALLAAQEGNWQDAAKYSKQATDLDPVEFPTSFWYNAVANYNLKNLGEAEKSTRALAKLDGRHKFPQAETMLAEFAENRGDLNDASAHLRAYLAAAPNATDADKMKAELARLEAALATQARSNPTVPR